MQIPPPFVQCSTEGNIDFSERQRAFALIVELRLHPCFFFFFFSWLLLQLNYSMSYLSFFFPPPDVERRLCAGARDFTLRREDSVTVTFM